MRELPNWLSASEHQMGVPERRARYRISTGMRVRSMLKVGDHVVYVPDGSKGIVVEVVENLCHVVWEDHFSSWEKPDALKKQEAFS